MKGRREEAGVGLTTVKTMNKKRKQNKQTNKQKLTIQKIVRLVYRKMIQHFQFVLFSWKLASAKQNNDYLTYGAVFK